MHSDVKSDLKVNILYLILQEGSEESFSAAGISNNSGKTNDTSSVTNQKAPSKGRSKGRKSRSRRNEWEIIEGLRDGQKCEQKPEKYEGYLSKRKKWPMKGWHKVGTSYYRIICLELN